MQSLNVSADAPGADGITFLPFVWCAEAETPAGSLIRPRTPKQRAFLYPKRITMGQPTQPQAAEVLRQMWREAKTAYYVAECDHTPAAWAARLNLAIETIEAANQLFHRGDLALLADIQAVYMAHAADEQKKQARHLFGALFDFAETTWANMDEMACFSYYLEKISQMAGTVADE